MRNVIGIVLIAVAAYVHGKDSSVVASTESPPNTETLPRDKLLVSKVIHKAVNKLICRACLKKALQTLNAWPLRRADLDNQTLATSQGSLSHGTRPSTSFNVKMQGTSLRKPFQFPVPSAQKLRNARSRIISHLWDIGKRDIWGRPYTPIEGEDMVDGKPRLQLKDFPGYDGNSMEWDGRFILPGKTNNRSSLYRLFINNGDWFSKDAGMEEGPYEFGGGKEPWTREQHEQLRHYPDYPEPKKMLWRAFRVMVYCWLFANFFVMGVLAPMAMQIPLMWLFCWIVQVIFPARPFKQFYDEPESWYGVAPKG